MPKAITQLDDLDRKVHFDKQPYLADLVICDINEGKPLKVLIQSGKYAGSIGTIDPKYLTVYMEDRSIHITAASYVIDIKGTKLRLGPTTTMHYSMIGQAPTAKVRLRKAATPEKPKTITDRHGVELKPGDPVLVAQMWKFVYGVLEIITPTAIVVKHGRRRTRIAFRDMGTKGLVKIDKDLASRFLMEKLASV